MNRCLAALAAFCFYGLLFAGNTTVCRADSPASASDFNNQPHTKAEITALLKGSDPVLRLAALYSVVGRDTFSSDEAVPLYSSLCLKNENTDVEFCGTLMEALLRYGQAAKPAMPLLLHLISEYGKNENLNTLAGNAILAASYIDPGNETVLKRCVSILKQSPKNYGIQCGIIDMATASGPKAAPLVPGLLALLQEKPEARNWTGNDRISLVFADLSPDLFEAVGRTEGDLSGKSPPALAQMLNAKQLPKVSAALQGLTKQGHSASAALPALVKRFNQSTHQSYLREAIITTMGTIGVGSHSDVAACVFRAKADEDYRTHLAAVAIINRIGPQDKALIPFIVADVESQVRKNGLLWRDAAWKLGTLTQFDADAAGASEITGRLLVAQGGSTWNGSENVEPYALLLAHIGLKAAPQRHYLLEGLRESRRLKARDTWSLYLALSRTGCTLRDVPDLPEVMRAALTQRDTKLFVAAALLAGSLGEDARPLVPLMAEALARLPDQTYQNAYLQNYFAYGRVFDTAPTTARLVLLGVLGRLGPIAASAVPVLTGFQTTAPDFDPPMSMAPRYGVRLNEAVRQTLREIQTTKDAT